MATADVSLRFKVDDRASAVLFALGIITEHVLIYGTASCPLPGPCVTCRRIGAA